jgi:hemerythrin superfamily protein
MSEFLAHDHAELGKLLDELCLALQTGEVQEIHQRLDLFWARLAVHIRAEHVVLFPAMLRALREDMRGAPSLTEAEKMIEELRTDHDFFMRELARAINLVRGLLKTSDNEPRSKELETVGAIIGSVAERLPAHNQLEEEGVYAWVDSVLNERRQSELAARVQTELERMPPRFE